MCFLLPLIDSVSGGKREMYILKGFLPVGSYTYLFCFHMRITDASLFFSKISHWGPQHWPSPGNKLEIQNLKPTYITVIVV